MISKAIVNLAAFIEEGVPDAEESVDGKTVNKHDQEPIEREER